MKKHIILTNGRSGSNYLAHTLNLHPSIVNVGEVLGGWAVPWKVYMPLKLFGIKETDFIHYIYSSRVFFYSAQIYSACVHFLRATPVNWKSYKRTLTIGIKEFFIHFENHTGLQYILADNSISVIYLSRSNLVRRYISMLHMQATQIVVAHQDCLNRKKIRVDISHMLKTLATMSKEIEQERAWMEKFIQAGHPIFEIKYEDYFCTEEALIKTNEALFRFLDVTPIAIKGTHRKILSHDLTDIIENYEEFSQALLASPFASSLSTD